MPEPAASAGDYLNTGRIAENGHPEYYKWTGLDVLLILEVWIDAELVTFRESIPTFMWMDYYSTSEHLESYLTHWIRTQLGKIAANPARLARYRERLLIVEPKDQHDYRRCKRSSEDAAMRVRCEDGMIIRQPLWIVRANPEPEPELLGACPCRCHRLQREARGLPGQIAGRLFFEEHLGEQEGLDGA